MAVETGPVQKMHRSWEDMGHEITKLHEFITRNKDSYSRTSLCLFAPTSSFGRLGKDLFPPLKTDS